MSPKTPAGEMTAPELRKLIRAHNILSKIVIPKGTDRQGLIKLIEGKNYKVDHKDKVIRPKQQRGKQITLKKAEELTKPKPVSEAVKKQRAEKKKEKEEEKKKDIKIAKKEAVQEFKSKQKEAKKKNKKAEKLNQKKDLKIKSILINKKDMGETQFIKDQKKLQLQKQKETRRALLKQNVKVDKTTRRGKPVKKELSKEERIKQLEKSIAQKKKEVEIQKKKNEEENKKLSTEEKKKKIKQLEEQVKKKEEALKKKSEKKEILKSEKKGKGGDPINKLTGPEAEELWDKVSALMNDGYVSDPKGKIYIGSPYASNLKDRKELLKVFISDKPPAREITKEEYDKIINRGKGSYGGLFSIYREKITGVEKKNPTTFDPVPWIFKKDPKKYMLLPQFFSDTIFGKKITKYDMKKVREIIIDYLKGDIGTKKKEKKEVKKVEDFKIMVRGRNYNREGFLNWVDKEGYKLSKSQLEKLNDLVVSYDLQSFRNYYNSNGVLVLVPTIKFNATDRKTKLQLGLVVSELAGQRGGAILKLELKPKEKIELTPEKIKEYDMTRLKFLKEEIPSLKKSRQEQLDILEKMDKERTAIGKKEDNDDKGLYTSQTYGSPNERYGYRQIEEDLREKAKGWKTKLSNGKQYYAPQGIRDWFEKNNVEAQRINSIIVNLYRTINGLENTEKKIKKKYDIK